MTKIYVCANCDAQFPKWQGRCSQCGVWGSLNEQTLDFAGGKKIKASGDKPINLNQISEKESNRRQTKINELDRVLGGGLVPGSLVLLAGDPGIGKSTLALQLAAQINDVLYISGEESAHQIKIRAQRLNLKLDQLRFLPQTNLETIIATIEAEKPNLAIIDSIQTTSTAAAAGGAGTISQITAGASQLLGLAKKTDIPIIIIGHVTKEGLVAGPKTLEHLVDTVIYLENDGQNYYKILRAVKNRFGSTGEIGIFEMTGAGLQEITNATEIFISKNQTPKIGQTTTLIMEGSRPFLAEIQSLVVKTNFGYPQRRATGLDLNRLQMIIAIINKNAKLNLNQHDVYLNVAGGLKIKETAADLAVALAIVSAFLEMPINPKTLILGELGLSGEIRTIPQLNRRIKEAEKLKFQKIITPAEKYLNATKTTKVNHLTEAFQCIKK